MVAFYQEGVGVKSSCGSIFMGMSKVSVCKENRGETPPPPKKMKKKTKNEKEKQGLS